MNNSTLPSNRSFGLLFASISLCFGLIGLYKGWAVLVVAVLFLAFVMLAVTTVLFPQLLAPLNRAWFHFGLILGKIVSPIVLGILFYGLLTPISVITRAFGRDELKLNPRKVTTYWVDRHPPGPNNDSFKNQF